MLKFIFFFINFRPELKGKCSIVRELHVYGSVVPVNARDPTKFQHQGFGMLLMEEAERIAREEHGSEKIAVISGVGTRNYYRKIGYELDGPYMSKMLVEKSVWSVKLAIQFSNFRNDVIYKLFYLHIRCIDFRIQKIIWLLFHHQMRDTRPSRTYRRLRYTETPQTSCGSCAKCIQQSRPQRNLKRKKNHSTCQIFSLMK